jgi:type I restriction enzyme M protein
MNSKLTDINPELIKLKQASQKALMEIRRQTSDESAYLYFFLTLLLLKDKLLPDVSFEMTYKYSDLKVNLIPATYNSKRKEFYRRIIEQLDLIESNPHFLMISIKCLKHIEVSLLSQKEIVEFFEFLLQQQFFKNKKRKSSVLFPKEFINIFDLIDQRKEKSIYNPFSRCGDFSLCKNYKIILCQESNRYDYFIHLIRILMHNLEECVELKHVNPTRTRDLNELTDKYDLIISMPPIGSIPKKSIYDELFPKNDNRLVPLRVKTLEEQFFDGLPFQKLNPEGKVICIVSQGFLISDEKSKKYRKEWIDYHFLETIVALPNLGDFTATSVQLYLLVLDTSSRENEYVRYIDGRNLYNKRESFFFKYNDFETLYTSKIEIPGLKFISYNLIQANQYTLQVDECLRGVRTGTKLGDICREIRNINREIFNANGKIVKNSDLKSHKNNFILDVDEIEFDQIDGHSEISESCLLIARMGGNIKPTYFIYTGESIYISQFIIALRVDETKVDIPYLINELYQDYIIEQINATLSGTRFPIFDKKKLLEIRIDIDQTITEQQVLIEKILSSYSPDIQQTSEQLDQLRKDIYKDIESKEHNILQHITNCGSSLRLLKHLLNKNQVVSSEYIEDVNSSIDNLTKSLTAAQDNIKLLSREISAEVKQEIDVNLFIDKWRKECFQDADLFDIDYDFDEDSFIIPVSDLSEGQIKIDPYAHIAPNLLIIVFNNILDNASRHSFKRKSKKYLFKIVLSSGVEKGFSDSLTIHIMINGDPFEPGSAQSYCDRGAKAGINANNGIGGADVCEIIKRYFNGDLEIIDLPESDFPVQFKIRIPISGWNKN